MQKLTCFKAYDVRGKLGEELNEDIAYRIGRAYGEFLKPKNIVLGSDVRLTSESLKLALAKGLQDAGTDVIDIGLTGTEEIYFATTYLKTDGGVEVTASHNPIDYNGMKLVRDGSRPISGDTGLRAIQELAEKNQFQAPTAMRGSYVRQDVLGAYVEHILSYVDVKNFKPLKLVINSGNGAAGHVIDAIEAQLKARGVPLEFIKVHHQPDGTHCCLSVARIPPMRCVSIALIWASRSTAISTAASCSMKKAILLRVIISSACWRRPSCRNSRARRSSTIHV
mgnify:CR=1 FL=1